MEQQDPALLAVVEALVRFDDEGPRERDARLRTRLDGLFGNIDATRELACARTFVEIHTPISDQNRYGMETAIPVVEKLLERGLAHDDIKNLGYEFLLELFTACWAEYLHGLKDPKELSKTSLTTYTQDQDPRRYSDKWRFSSETIQRINRLIAAGRKANHPCVRRPKIPVHQASSGSEMTPMQVHVVNLLAQGKLRLAEATLRFFAWSGSFDPALELPEPTEFRAHGKEAAPLYHVLVEHALAAVRVAQLQNNDEIAVALASFVMIHAKACDVPINSEEMSAVIAVATKKSERKQPIALHMLDSLNRDTSREECEAMNAWADQYTRAMVRDGAANLEGAPREYIQALEDWERLFNETPSFGGFRFHEGKPHWSDISHPTFMIVGKKYRFKAHEPRQQRLIRLLAQGRWIMAHRLVEWFGWTGAFGKGAERWDIGKRAERRGLGPIDRVQVALFLRDFLLPAMYLARRKGRWGVAAALGQLALLEKIDLVKEFAEPTAKQEFEEREDEYARRREKYCLVSVGCFSIESNDLEPDTRREPSPELIAEGEELTRQKSKRVLEIATRTRQDIEHSLAMALQYGATIGFPILE